MKKANYIVIASIIATFVFSMFVIQPTTEASNNVSPSASPSATPRKRKLPRPIQSPVAVDRTKVKSPTTFKNVGGLSIETERRKQPRKRRRH